MEEKRVASADATTVDALSFRLEAKEGHLYGRVMSLYKIIFESRDSLEESIELEKWSYGVGEYSEDYESMLPEQKESERWKRY